MVGSAPKGWGGMVLAAGGGLLDGWGGMVNRWRATLQQGSNPTQPPYTAADTMPTHGGPGRFDTVAGLLAATPPQLRLLDSSLPDDAERAAVRSCCAGTLASCIAQLDAAIAPHAVRMMDGRLPTSDAFRGDDHDLSKLKALKTVATMVLQDGPMLYREACASLVHARSTFFSDLNAALDADVVDSAFRFKSPSWLAKRAGHELLARVPLVRVPLASYGAEGGVRESLLMPIIPALSDAELLEHIDLIMELREAREAAAQQRGAPFDATKYRRLISALPASVRVPVEFIIVKAAGEDAARDLGIMVSDAHVRRFDGACADGGPLEMALREGEISLMADLAKRANDVSAWSA